MPTQCVPCVEKTRMALTPDSPNQAVKTALRPISAIMENSKVPIVGSEARTCMLLHDLIGRDVFA